jgi:fatty acid desaturase
LRREHTHCKRSVRHDRERHITMLFWIIAVAVVAFVALTVLGFALHLILSPWLLVIIGLLVWIKYRPRRRNQ